MPEYYLQVLKEDGARPKWSEPEDELIIGSQALEDGYTQYWAYPKDSGRESEDLPPVELLAQKYQTPKPAILIDEPDQFGRTAQPLGEGDYLELVLVKNGHALSKSESSLANLEDNLNSILNFARSNFDIKIDHFITTDRVSSRIEKKLDELEKTGQEVSSDIGSGTDEWCFSGKGIKQTELSDSNPLEGCGMYSDKNQTREDDNQKTLFINPKILIILFLVMLFAGGFIFKDKISSKFLKQEEVVAPTVTPVKEMPTPTPTIVRQELKVRVLNGTIKTGAAATLGDELKTKGWGILKVGNAPKQDLTQTTIKAKDGMERAVEAMVEDLSSSLEASVSGALDKDDKADLEVIIGRR